MHIKGKRIAHLWEIFLQCLTQQQHRIRFFVITLPLYIQPKQLADIKRIFLLYCQPVCFPKKRIRLASKCIKFDFSFQVSIAQLFFRGKFLRMFNLGKVKVCTIERSDKSPFRLIQQMTRRICTASQQPHPTNTHHQQQSRHVLHKHSY